MTALSRSDLRARTPAKWSLSSTNGALLFSTGSSATSDGSLAVWEYDHRGTEVRIETADRDSDIRSTESAYTAVAETTVSATHHEPPSPSLVTAVDVAIEVMRGFDGVTASDLRTRLGLSPSASSTVASRIREWDDLANRYNDGLTDLSGVGPATAGRLAVATTPDYLDRDPVDLVVIEDPAESDRNWVAVYRGLPAVNNDREIGWRIEKQWRDPADGTVGSSVVLPIDRTEQDWWPTKKQAHEASGEFAEVNVGTTECHRLDCNQPATVWFTVNGSIYHWYQECYDQPCKSRTAGECDGVVASTSDSNRIKGLCHHCRTEIASWSDSESNNEPKTTPSETDKARVSLSGERQCLTSTPSSTEDTNADNTSHSTAPETVLEAAGENAAGHPTGTDTDGIGQSYSEPAQNTLSLFGSRLLVG